MKTYLHWWFPALILLAAVILLSIDSHDQRLFRYDRSGVFGEDYWRLITGHFTHLGWSHLVLNMSVMLVFWQLYHRVFPPLIWATLTLLCALGISLAYVFLEPDLEWYVGFSGVLHGLFMAVVITLLLNYLKWKQIRFPWEALFLFAAILGKIIFEQTIGSLSFTTKASGGDVFVNAHLYGAGMGVVLSVLAFSMQKPNAQINSGL